MEKRDFGHQERDISVNFLTTEEKFVSLAQRVNAASGLLRMQLTSTYCYLHDLLGVYFGGHPSSLEPRRRRGSFAFSSE